MGSYNSYASMKAKLAPLGIYTLAEGSVTDCELKAYAAGIDRLFDTLDIAERESFIETAETYGLSEREKFADKEKPELPVSSILPWRIQWTEEPGGLQSMGSQRVRHD